MKKLFVLALAILTMGSQVQAETQAKKKEKKETTWEWDGKKSGNATIDNYLMQIDTLWNRMQEYKKSIEDYKFVTDTLLIDGEYYVLGHMETSDGQLVTRGTVNWQCAQAVMNGVNIVLDMTNAGLGAANAALELPSLGLKALQFGKYVKGGPAVISAGISSVKEIRGQWISNSRKWKELKDGAIEDPSTLNYQFKPDVLEKINKCMYLKKIVKGNDEDFDKWFEIQTEIAVDRGITTDVLMTENTGKVMDTIAMQIVLPEDKNKTKDGLDLKEMENMIATERKENA